MTRWVWAALAAGLVGLDVYLLGWQWGLVGGNVLAQFIITTPAFIAQHLALKRHMDRRHAELHARLDAQDHAAASLRKEHRA